MLPPSPSTSDHPQCHIRLLILHILQVVSDHPALPSSRILSGQFSQLLYPRYNLLYLKLSPFTLPHPKVLLQGTSNHQGSCWQVPLNNGFFTRAGCLPGCGRKLSPHHPHQPRGTRRLRINLNHYILYLLRQQASVEWNLKESSGLS